MNHHEKMSSIEVLFQRQVLKDPKVINAFLLVHSDNSGLHINLAKGTGENGRPNPQQPNYMASVGKLFTSVMVSKLHEQGLLSFEDRITSFLDSALMDSLHVYKGKDYSQDIQIRHLLNQTSGLPDNFYPLFKKLLVDPSFDPGPREAIEWAKKNLTPKAVPGKKSHYTDTNYHLLGLIVEKVCGEPFHAVLKKLIFDPVGMKHAYMLHYSEPEQASPQPEAGFYVDQTRLNDIKGFAGIDYAGGGVVAPLDEMLLFMKALVGHQLVSKETLAIMKQDKASLNPAFDYGYGIWQVRNIPLLMPAKYRSWGVLGATGAFMFYHPELNAYLIGNFNHLTWQKKCVRFMFKVMDRLRE
ncbi:serine hydrolase [candidate division KSB1 bacterium]|nr:serine hydrolase [candidate division KSB1 bacterium]